MCNDVSEVVERFSIYYIFVDDCRPCNFSQDLENYQLCENVQQLAEKGIR